MTSEAGEAREEKGGLSSKKVAMKRTITTFIPHALDEKQATSIFEYLRDNIKWEEGIKSRKGPTRLAKAIHLSEYPEVEEIIQMCLPPEKTYVVFGVYLNYYQNGNMWTPSHSHPGTVQLVISLGATRTLTVGKKKYQMGNGSSVVFGSSSHGIEKEPEVQEGRISIATFMREVNG